MRFILGSASPARLTLLRSAGVEPHVVVSDVDEDAVAEALTDPSPGELVSALANAKADAVVAMASSAHPEAVIVTCDTMLLLDGKMCGKPPTPDAARAQWLSMAGRAGELLTGHVVVRTEQGIETKRAVGVQTTTVHFGEPTPEELDAYIASGIPLRVSGSFDIEMGGWFIDSFDGDVGNVIGISLPMTRKLLGEVGVGIVDLWQQR